MRWSGRSLLGESRVLVDSLERPLSEAPEVIRGEFSRPPLDWCRTYSPLIASKILLTSHQRANGRRSFKRVIAGQGIFRQSRRMIAVWKARDQGVAGSNPVSPTIVVSRDIVYRCLG